MCVCVAERDGSRSWDPSWASSASSPVWCGWRLDGPGSDGSCCPPITAGGQQESLQGHQCVGTHGHQVLWLQGPGHCQVQAELTPCSPLDVSARAKGSSPMWGDAMKAQGPVACPSCFCSSQRQSQAKTFSDALRHPLPACSQRECFPAVLRALSGLLGIPGHGWVFFLPQAGTQTLPTAPGGWTCVCASVPAPRCV